MYQVFKRNVPWEPFMDAAGDVADLRQLLGKLPLSPFFIPIAIAIPIPILVLPRLLHSSDSISRS